jgi:MFS family permease
VGIVSNPIFGVAIFVILGGFYRMRRIVVNAFLLRDCPTKNLKATYLSMYAFFASFNMIWVPIILGFVVGHFSVRFGYMIFGFAAITIFVILFLIVFMRRGELFNHDLNEKKVFVGQ